MKRLIAAVPLMLTTLVVQADPLDSIGALSQGEFKTLTENLGAATSYKAVAPGETLGVIGIDVGVELSSTEIDDDVLDRASLGDADMDTLFIPKLHAHKGLPFGLDIGVSAGFIPDTDITVWGGELRYALLDGGVATPAIGLRGSYSRIEGQDDLDLSNAAVELAISKGFLMLTPYGGVGYVSTTGKPDNSYVNLDDETVDAGKVYVGLNVNLGVNLSFELDRTGDYTTYSAKAGLRF